MGPASCRFGRIHRQIGVLQNLIEIRTVLRSERNSDAGVRRHLMTVTGVGRTDRIENSRHQVGGVGRSLDPGLDDGEFVATQPGDEVGAADATAQADSHGSQQLIADHMSERIVDAFEFVDIDIQHRQLFARSDAKQFLFQLFVKQCAVRQVGEGVVVGEMCDPLLSAPALRDILLRHHPSAIRQRFVYNQY